MKDQLQRLEKVTAKIERIELEIGVTSTSNYYNLFGSETERERDLAVLRNELRKHQSQRFTVLETLQMEIEKEKRSISSLLRGINLKS